MTEYHQPKHSGQKYTRTEVEAAWNSIRSAAEEYRSSRHDLDNLEIYLAFVSLKAPSKKEIKNFVELIFEVIDSAKSSLGKSETKIEICRDHPDLLWRHLKYIRIKHADYYSEWTWNQGYLRCGPTEDEIIDIVKNKIGKLDQIKRSDFDEIKLLIDGNGSNGGWFIGRLEPDLLRTWKRLSTELASSGFDELAILHHGGACLWRSGIEWATMTRN